MHRTRFNFVVRYTKTFFIMTPDCVYDDVNQKNLPFAWTDASLPEDYFGNHSFWTPLAGNFPA